MSGDSNGYNRGQGYPDEPGEPGEPAQSPWSVRPGPPVYQGPGADADAPGAQYGGTSGYGQGPQQAPYGATQSAPYAPYDQPTRAAHSAPSGVGGYQPFPPAASAGGDGGEPDWGALAEQAGRSSRRRRTLIWAGSVVAVLAIGGGIAFASLKVSEGDGTKTTANTPGTASAPPVTAPPEAPKPTFKPAPSIPPAPGAAKVLADPALDTAPFTVAELFPDAQFTQDRRTYTVAAKQLDNTCANAVNAELAKILRNSQCAQMIRVTVTAADGTAATVALGAFPTANEAKAAADEGNKKFAVAAVTGLAGGGVRVLCPEPTPGKPGVRCARQTNFHGRYGIFAVVGYPGTVNKLTGPDAKVDQLGNDIDTWVRAVLDKRGEKTSQAIYDKAKAEAEKQLQG